MLTPILRKRASNGRFIREYILPKDEIVSKYKKGWALNDLKNLFCCDRSVIKKILKENYVKLRNNKEARQGGTLYYQKIKSTRLNKNNPNWKGGFTIGKKTNYVYILNKGIRQQEHQYIMEKKIKRKLLSNEFIHHIDGVRSNNKINNLIILNGHKWHNKVHASLQSIAYALVRLKVIKFNRKILEYFINF